MIKCKTCRSFKALAAILFLSALSAAAVPADDADCLTEQTKSADVLVRQRAVAAVQWIEGPHAVDALIPALGDSNAKVRKTAAHALGYAGDQRAVEPLIALLKDSDPLVANTAAESLGRLKAAAAVQPIISTLPQRELNYDVANRALIDIGSPAVDSIIAIVEGSDQNQRGRVIRLLGEIKDPRCAPVLLNELKKDGKYKNDVFYALGRQKDIRAVEPLIAILQGKDQEDAKEAFSALCAIGDPSVIPALISALKNSDPYSSGCVPVYALGRMGKVAFKPLIAALDSPTPMIRCGAVEALSVMQDPAAIAPIISLLKREKDYSRQMWMVDELWKFGNPAMRPMVGLLADQNYRCLVMESFYYIRNRDAVVPLISALKTKDVGVRDNAAHALANQNDARAIPALISLLKDDECCGSAANGLAMLKAKDAVSHLIPLLNFKGHYHDREDPDNDVYVQQSAIAALGAIGDTRAVPNLIAKLGSKNSETRLTVVFALAELKDSRAINLLAAVVNNPVKSEEYSENCWRAMDALGKFRTPTATACLLTMLQNRKPNIRWMALSALGEIGDPSTADNVKALLNDADKSVRESAVRALCAIQPPDSVEALLGLMSYDDERTLIAARATFPRIKDPKAIDSLLSHIKEGDHKAAFACEELGRRKEARAVEPLINFLETTVSSRSMSKDRAGAVAALGEIGDARAVPVLIAALREYDWWVDESTPPDISLIAADALGKLKDSRAVWPLIVVLGETDPKDRPKVADALKKITGQSFGADSDAWRKWWKSSQSLLQHQIP